MLAAAAVPQELLVRYNKAGLLDGAVNLQLPPIRQRLVEVGVRDARAGRVAAGLAAAGRWVGSCSGAARCRRRVSARVTRECAAHAPPA